MNSFTSSETSVVGYQSQAATITWVGGVTDPNSATYTASNPQGVDAGFADATPLADLNPSGLSQFRFGMYPNPQHRNVCRKDLPRLG
jgi:hypothetical protein